MHYRLILGNMNYSSWSLRSWLLFEAFGIPFEFQVVPLYTNEFEIFRSEYYPARQVPTLEATDSGRRIVVWDSLSIAEFLNEQHPEARLWPSDLANRAAARSLSAEMHSGFNALRSKLPMNLRRRYARFVPDEDAQADIERIVSLWRWAMSLSAHDGPYLFGNRFTAADAFFAPVAERFQTYSISLDGPSKKYVEAILEHPATASYREMAEAEVWVMEHNEIDID